MTILSDNHASLRMTELGWEKSFGEFRGLVVR
jgi:hypothetical protein